MSVAWPRGGEGFGGQFSHFCLDGSRDFLKINYKISGERGSSIFSEKKRA